MNVFSLGFWFHSKDFYNRQNKINVKIVRPFLPFKKAIFTWNQTLIIVEKINYFLFFPNQNAVNTIKIQFQLYFHKWLVKTKNVGIFTKYFFNILFVFFQAALETKHKMGPAADKIYLIHFNDVYDIESGDKVSIFGNIFLV